MSTYFKAADILLPKTADMGKWAVIACDQFTSDVAYWERVRRNADNVVSTLHMILPEAELPAANEDTIAAINACMRNYLANDVFVEYKNAYIYVERTLQNGMIRQGIVGMLDLEHYEYDPALHPMISATEKTVLERIPPRVAVRKDAELEFTHVLLLCEDPACHLIESVAAVKDSLPQLYDFNLMENGGHIAGWLVAGENAAAFDRLLDQYEQNNVYLVGDGNHSLVTAKTCYEAIKSTGVQTCDHPARYAMVELENIHSPAMTFEPIHRILTKVDAAKLLQDLQSICGSEGDCVEWIVGKSKGKLMIQTPKGELTVGILQQFLDQWLQENAGEIDYIHGDDAVEELAQQDNAIGFLLPGMPKSALFPFVATGRTLPRKTFSMGHGCEKRYYLEGRRIK